MADNQVDLKLNLDFQGVNDALYELIGQFNGTDKEFAKIEKSITNNAKKLEAAIKLFGPASQEASRFTKALSRDFLSLAANGVDPLSDSFKKLTSSMPKPASLDASTGSLKKNNMQWTNLALVIQDLPFGFRGIQNNLPALMGSVAGATGPMYLAFSALIAAVTAYDLGIFGATKKTVDFRKALKETNDEIKNTVNYTNSEVSNLQGLVDVMLDVNTSESIRNKALQEAKEAITQVDEAQGKKIKTIGDAIIAINLYTEAIQQQQMQEVIGKKIAEITISQIERRNTLAIETAKANKGIHPINWFMGNTELQNLESEILANETLLRQLEDFRKSNTKALLLNPTSKYNATKPNNKGEADEKARLKRIQNFNLQVLQDTINSKKQELKLYDDDANKKYQVSEQLAIAERELSLKKIEYSEYDEKQKAILNEAVYKEYSDQILLLSQQMQEQLLVQDDKARKEKQKRDKKELREFTDGYQNQLKDFDEFYKNKQNLSTGDRQSQKLIYEQQSSDLQYMLENDLISYQDYINRLGVIFKGWTNNNKAIAEEAANFVQQIGIGMMNAIGPALDMLLEKGASIGDVLDRALTDLIKKLAKVAIAAAVVVTLLAIAGIVDWAEFGKTFVKFTSSGMGINPNLISSSPTSAANAKESVTDITSVSASQNQTLVAQVSGNDLLVLLNRTSRNNNNTF
jgi:hypothetical protein